MSKGPSGWSSSSPDLYDVQRGLTSQSSLPRVAFRPKWTVSRGGESPRRTGGSLLDRFIKAGEIRPITGWGSRSKNRDDQPERPHRVSDPGYHKGRIPANKGRTYPVEILTPEEVVDLMRACPPSARGMRMRALITVLYRAGLRISEALQLYPKDIAPGSGTIGSCGEPRRAGLERWAAIPPPWGSSWSGWRCVAASGLPRLPPSSAPT
jgi:hypothetical protein